MTRSQEYGLPNERIRVIHDNPLRPEGAYVIYWMTSARRTRYNFGLDRAIALAREFGRPLVVLEPLRVGYRWASDRLHRFVIDGMRDNPSARWPAKTRTTTPMLSPSREPARGCWRGSRRTPVLS